ncbi:MAG: response regulator [Desulfatitalea sp.]|nr:response regulator [Desulfatitalea sp.]NNJ99690.1 response regulator [Desulfatitalea sp.]
MNGTVDPRVVKAQRLRVKRWLIGVVAYAIVMVAIYISRFIGMGTLQPRIFLVFLLLAVVANALVFISLKTNFNLRFKDPSLTLAQMIFSCFWGGIPLYLMPDARLVFMLFFLISFCFGIFQLNFADYMKVLGTIFVLYSAVLLVEYTTQRPGFVLSVEIYQLVMFMLLLSWFVFFGSYISAMRMRLRQQNIELTEAHDQIRKEIMEREAANDARIKAEAKLQSARKMEAIGMLAGGVAHDLNNILSGLVSYPELLLHDLPADNPLHKTLTTIFQSGQKAATIVQDLLIMARRGVAVTQTVNLNQIVTEYLESTQFAKLLQFHPNTKINTNLVADLRPLTGSPAHLFAAVMNLVSNAAEAMPEGGTIDIHTSNRHVPQTTTDYESIEAGEYSCLTISDTGVGLSAQEQERIFEPFYTKKVMGRSGTGLGMAVVWGTTKDHHGHIDLRSRPGQGTVISLYFPPADTNTTSDLLVPVSDYRGQGESILIVDDIAEQREIISLMLEKLGYHVQSVSSGEAAVAFMRHNQVDLLVLDMIMDPGINGLETYRQIAALHPGQKAVIASGYSETEWIAEAMRMGLGGSLKKPFLFEELGVAIRAALDRPPAEGLLHK